ncbi:uncharacterized protein NEMAJ01_0994 [Nematocida major]|uniref:uncharacterized protein n=1 Tax=Nematocida major TaxID=1912982 RepID=UPI002008A63B|nr:uncharacterized protein NEMAJ01_0994 [Nematocida major]KAH9386098.1 hypothetical protein NEMAJ01_0994 [Nematocida major]
MVGYKNNVYSQLEEEKNIKAAAETCKYSTEEHSERPDGWLYKCNEAMKQVLMGLFPSNRLICLLCILYIVLLLGIDVSFKTVILPNITNKYPYIYENILGQHTVFNFIFSFVSVILILASATRLHQKGIMHRILFLINLCVCFFFIPIVRSAINTMSPISKKSLRENVWNFAFVMWVSTFFNIIALSALLADSTYFIYEKKEKIEKALEKDPSCKEKLGTHYVVMYTLIAISVVFAVMLIYVTSQWIKIWNPFCLYHQILAAMEMPNVDYVPGYCNI